MNKLEFSEIPELSIYERLGCMNYKELLGRVRAAATYLAEINRTIGSEPARAMFCILDGAETEDVLGRARAVVSYILHDVCQIRIEKLVYAMVTGEEFDET